MALLPPLLSTTSSSCRTSNRSHARVTPRRIRSRQRGLLCPTIASTILISCSIKSTTRPAELATKEKRETDVKNRPEFTRAAPGHACTNRVDKKEKAGASLQPNPAIVPHVDSAYPNLRITHARGPGAPHVRARHAAAPGFRVRSHGPPPQNGKLAEPTSLQKPGPPSLGRIGRHAS